MNKMKIQLTYKCQQDSGSVVERNDYYPLGMRTATGNSYPQLAANLYKYNGKEVQTVGGLGFTDYGARMYDDFTGRWFVPDPLAEKYASMSPYMYCGGNPILMTDVYGLAWRPIKNENTGEVTGYEWWDESISYNGNGNLREILYHQAIFFGENGNYNQNSNYNLGSSTAYLYLADGSIIQFRACTHPSNPKENATIPAGLYEAKVGIHGGEKSQYVALRVGDLKTKNFLLNKIDLKAPNPSNPKTNDATGINIHKAGGGDLTGIDSKGLLMSKGCFLISINDWDEFIGYFNNNLQKDNVVSIALSRTMAEPVNGVKYNIPSIRYPLPMTIPAQRLSLP